MNLNSKQTILIVEDEILSALSTKKQLEKEGFIVDHVLNGELAIQYTKDRTFDLILMDIDLGKGLDGIETAELILRDHSVPIVFLSAHSEKEHIQKIERTTSYGYVAKGSHFNVLNASIKMALKLFIANQKMERSEQNYRRLIDISPIPYALNDNFENVVYLNKAFVSTFGYTMEDLHTLADWWPKAYPDETYRNWIQETWGNQLERTRTLKLPIDPIEIKIRCKDGSVKTVLASISILDEKSQDVHLVMLYDITESKNKEETAKHNTQLLETSQKISKVGGWEVNVVTGETFWTVETFRIHESTPEDFKPSVELASEYLFPESKQKFFTAFEIAAEQGLGFDLELQAYTKKDKIVFIRVTCVAIFENGKPYKLTGIVQDITEQKQKEETIKKLLAEKDLLLKEIHHRIKNNMNTVSSLLNIQADLIEESKNKEILFDAAARVHSMMVLYDKLYISKNQNSVSLHIYLPTLLEEIKSIFSTSQNIEMICEIEEIELTPKYLSPLGIIFNELITNSLKYAFKERKSGKIHITGKFIENKIQLTYTDDGPGIPVGISFENSTGFGLQLILMLVKQVAGSIEIQRKNLTTIEINFKI